MGKKNPNPDYKSKTDGAPGHTETRNPNKAPTAKPSRFPTSSGAPSRNPNSNPTSQPSGQPSGQPSSRQPSIASNSLNSSQPTVFLNNSIPCPPGYNRTIIGYNNFYDKFNSTSGNFTSINNNNGSVPIYGNCSLIEQPNHSRNNAAATNLLPLYIVAGIIGACIVGAICFFGYRSPAKIRGAAVSPREEEGPPNTVIINKESVVNQKQEGIMYDSDASDIEEAGQKKTRGNFRQLVREDIELSHGEIEINFKEGKERHKNAVVRTQQPRNHGGGGNGFVF